jgi:hypothetical protein
VGVGMICKIDGCENKHYGLGWCEKHYTRWRKHGDPNIVKQERHGYRNHFLYGVWGNMRTRCYSENNKGYRNYGDRGITICDEWMNPKVFIEWCLNNGWKSGLQIDRRDNDGNYCPENCRFVTQIENNHNQRLLTVRNTSGYRGVSKRNKKWEARISIDNKNKHLGYFNTAKEAAMAYDRAVPDNRPKNFK